MHARSSRVLGFVLFGAALAACAEDPAPPPPVAATPPVANAPAAPPAATVASARPDATITLVTGDRVHLRRGPDGKRIAVFAPGPGRERIGYSTTVRKHDGREDLLVVPRDAMPLLAAGKLDERLFDVDELARQELDDRSRATVPLIVTYAPGVAKPRSLPHAAGVRLGRALPSVRSAVLVADKRDAAALWSWITRAEQAGVAKIWLDARKHVVDDGSNPQIGVPAAWQAGFTGAGVVVADLDTGVDTAHPDLQGVVTLAVDFSESESGVDDLSGHGTHTATIIAGSGAASGGLYRGVAPDAQLLVGKVCGDDGSCFDSAIIAGMEWAVANQAAVVNMSLGGWATDGTDPLSQAVNELTASSGTLFVIAAGNEGWDFSVGTPGAADAALTVGSVTKEDQLSYFSSRGPRLGDLAIKPDLVAPGSDIIAGRSAHGSIGTHVDEYYTILSGTSMATPHVTGAVAILAQQHPEWKAERFKHALVSTTQPLPDLSVYAEGSGRLDVGRAVTQPVHAITGSLSYGTVPFPHDTPITRTVTYQNDGDTDVVLGLTIAATDASGMPAPDGFFSVPAGDVVVPAQGSVDVPVTLDASVGPLGLYSGRLVAAGTSTQLVTSLGGFKEPESFDVTLHVLTHAGMPTPEADAFFVDVTTGGVHGRGIGDFDEQGTTHLRVPRGTYDLISYIFEPGFSGEVAGIVQPGLTVDRPLELTLDGRTAQPITTQVDRPATLTQNNMEVSSLVNGSGLERQFTGLGAPMFITPTPPVTGHDFAFAHKAVLDSPVGVAVPYQYNLVFGEKGRVPAELAFRARDRDLAAVLANYRAQGVALDGEQRPQRSAFAEMAGVSTSGFFLGGPIPVPLVRLEYYTARPDVRWLHAELFIDFETFAIEWQSGESSYVPGFSFQDWNRAPYGPHFGGGDSPGALRYGDQLYFLLPLFSAGEAAHTAVPTVSSMVGLTTLSKDGVIVGESNYAGFGRFVIDEEPAEYTLHSVGERHVPWSTIGTHTEATWTFTTAGDVYTSAVPQPLLAVRVGALLDSDNAARAGTLFPLVLDVERQPGAPAAEVTKLALEVSYDDGATWTKVPVWRSGSRGVALLSHPVGASFVALRTRAQASDGSSVELTQQRAYHLCAAP